MRVLSFGLGALLSFATSAASAQDGTAPPPPAPAPVIVTVTAAPAPASAPASSVAYVPPGSSSTGLYDPPPARRRTKHWELIGPGIALFAGGWLLTWLSTSIWYGETTSCTSTGWFGYSCTHYGPDDWALAMSFIPLAGPWLMLGSDNLSGGDFVPPVLFGLTQLTGLVLLIVGLALPGDEVTVDPYAFRIGVAPAPGGGVLTASGSF